jgi:hypothetical protein
MSGDARVEQRDSPLEHVPVVSIGVRHGSIESRVLMLEMEMAFVRTELRSPNRSI